MKSTSTSTSTLAGAASTSPSNSPSQSQSSSGVSPGTIAAIVVAVLLGLALVGVAGFVYKRRQRRSIGGARGIPKITFDAEKGKSISIDRSTGAALGKDGMCSETTSLTQEAPPTPSTPGFPDDAQERYEMSTPPPRVYETDARPSYSPFPRVASRRQ